MENEALKYSRFSLLGAVLRILISVFRVHFSEQLSYQRESLLQQSFSIQNSSAAESITVKKLFILYNYRFKQMKRVTYIIIRLYTV
jgi:hypothetical protein